MANLTSTLTASAATTAPDPLTLTSWSDAFAYPLPTVRHLSSRLRSAQTANAGALRACVGAAYRDLLGTADRIVTMEGRLEEVESGLARLGKGCDARVVERKSRNAAVLNQRGKREKRERVARLKFLQTLVTVAGDLLRRKGMGDALLIAKVWVSTLR